MRAMRYGNELDWLKWVLKSQGVFGLNIQDVLEEDRQRTFMREMPEGTPCPVYTLGEIIVRYKELR